MNKRLLYLIRHPTVLNPERLCYGRAEMPLGGDAMSEAAAVMQRLGLDRDSYQVYASPAGRCLWLAHRLSASVRIEPCLQELDFGEWEGQAWDNISEDAVQTWSEDFVAARPPGGESFNELSQRAATIWPRLEAEEGAIVCVTHAGVIRALLCEVLGWSLSKAWSLEIAPARFSKISFNATSRSVEGINL